MPFVLPFFFLHHKRSGFLSPLISHGKAQEKKIKAGQDICCPGFLGVLQPRRQWFALQASLQGSGRRLLPTRRPDGEFARHDGDWVAHSAFSPDLSQAISKSWIGSRVSGVGTELDGELKPPNGAGNIRRHWWSAGIGTAFMVGTCWDGPQPPPPPRWGQRETPPTPAMGIVATPLLRDTRVGEAKRDLASLQGDGVIYLLLLLF